MRSILGLGAALAVASLHVASPNFDAPVPRRKGLAPRNSAPNDFGPVIDTTPESKRARRRRLARQERKS